MTPNTIAKNTELIAIAVNRSSSESMTIVPNATATTAANPGRVPREDCPPSADSTGRTVPGVSRGALTG